ncbi:MAG TPA: agmatine deiminase family protein, partial [Trueperaceae bacterium]|nr:agmatine deiminase family protein [Trueperaceae bacterium]
MSTPTKPSPAPLGLSMPPEWAPHAATWTSWPFDDELWVGHLDGVRAEFARLVATISRFEPVLVNVRDDEVEEDARRRLELVAGRPDNVSFNRVALNDVWFRDNGPIFVHRAGGDRAVSLTDWRFNAWGGKYAPWDDDDRAPAQVAQRLGMLRHEVDLVLEGGSIEVNGEGVCLTTQSCLLSPERNPGVGVEEIEEALRRYLGVTEVVWLAAGLEGDHTDGHIDTIVRFSDASTILCSVEDDENDPNHATMSANLAQLRGWNERRGETQRVVTLPLPARRM